MSKEDNSTRKNLIIVGAFIALILILDQVIKIYVKSNFLPGEAKPLLGDWFVMEYTENPGMAFGTTFGNKAWHKLALSIFRIIAISGLCYYWVKQAKLKMKREFLFALGLIIAGATGNLIDSMFYDYAFAYDPCFPYNLREGSGIFADCDFWMDKVETRPHGFLMGNVVDMFKFHGYWPDWMPLIGGKDLFPAIWNVADGSITLGVLMIFIRQRTYFSKKKRVFLQYVDQSDEITDSKQENSTID